ECNLDNERRNKKGKEMSLLDFLQIKYGNSKIDDTIRARRSVKSVVLNECILDSFDVEFEFVKIYNDPYSRGLEEYKAMFNNEIEKLENDTSWTTYGENVNRSMGEQCTHGTMKDLKKKSD
ncbi:hypothetical protein Tco_0816762, partial [Tanacetum coccineum]